MEPPSAMKTDFVSDTGYRLEANIAAGMINAPAGEYSAEAKLIVNEDGSAVLIASNMTKAD